MITNGAGINTYNVNVGFILNRAAPMNTGSRMFTRKPCVDWDTNPCRLSVSPVTRCMRIPTWCRS
ncbi:MAG: hypothetical protein BWY06_03108 [Candidatus Latescibacteria bacterium ADurb.Bin168]|nr:MAG: hypothetical protein BWY06_03108 [Candidatus Latescibacteria bacterium ADurb.Bin168]